MRPAPTFVFSNDNGPQAQGAVMHLTDSEIAEVKKRRAKARKQERNGVVFSICATAIIMVPFSWYLFHI